MPVSLIAIVACSMLAALCLISRRPSLNGTTLVGPWRWLFSWVCLGLVVELGAYWGQSSPTMTEVWRYVFTVGAFCPLMAILGAKRPQNIGWQFIVGTLWVVLILPAGELLVLWQGGELDVGPMREWLFVVLLLVGFTNYALTRHTLVALLATLSVAVMLWQHLPAVAQVPWLDFRWGLIGSGLAIILLWWQTRERDERVGWDRLWVDFRDHFGLVWGLRVMERVNATGKLCGWKQELGWFGFAGSEPFTEDEEAQRERTIRTLLRRFVSSEWIDVRVHGKD